MQLVSIVLPAKNEAETIGRVLKEVRTVTASSLHQYNVEVIVVDDHSSDSTAVIAVSYGARLLINEYPSGKGYALRYGFERAQGGIIVMMDADGSHSASDLPTLLTPLYQSSEVGLVIGSRVYGGSDEYTRLRAFGNLFLTYMFGFFHGRYLSDALNGYKAFRRDVFTGARYDSKAFEIEIELLANALRAGYQIIEVPSHERKRAGGVAKSRALKHGLRFLARIFLEARRGNKRPDFDEAEGVTTGP